MVFLMKNHIKIIHLLRIKHIFLILNIIKDLIQCLIALELLIMEDFKTIEMMILGMEETIIMAEIGVLRWIITRIRVLDKALVQGQKGERPSPRKSRRNRSKHPRKPHRSRNEECPTATTPNQGRAFSSASESSWFRSNRSALWKT